ncbi:MAG: hypothetical protein H6Q38_2782 [Chloroflexi bacterium]|nr:hypothetical protein [Chloroflexota bacterium]
MGTEHAGFRSSAALLLQQFLGQRLVPGGGISVGEECSILRLGLQHPNGGLHLAYRRG